MAKPISAAARFDTIDIVRGIALYGVMAINVVTEFRISIFQQFLPKAPESGPPNRFVDALLADVWDMKAFSLFSLLFGVGLAIQYERLSADHTANRLLLRRLAALLVFGLIHLFLIWNGDILTEYAIAGLLVLPLLARSPWTLGVAATYCLLLYCAMPYLHAPWPSHEQFQREVLAANAAYAQGDFFTVLQFRIHEVGGFIPLHIAIFARTVGLFLLGALIWKLRILQDPVEHSLSIAACAVLGLAAGTALTATNVDSTVAPPVLALAYGASIVWLSVFTPARRILTLFAPLGRMAFTNYILQSVIFGFIFYGYGLGLFGRIGSAAALLIGTTLYGLQMVLSAWWLRRYRFGPMEWLWRSVMYGTLQSMRPSRVPRVSNEWV